MCQYWAHLSGAVMWYMYAQRLEMTTSEDISSGYPYRTTGDCVGMWCENG